MSLRFAILGTGRIAGDYLNALEDVAELELVAVADARAELAQAVGERRGVPAFADIDAVFESCEVDAVLVAVPPHLHEELSIRALERGAHVLCEKPFAMDEASALRMLAAAEGAGRLLTMSAKFRHVPDVIEAKARLDAGSIGRVVLLRQSFFASVPMAERWNSDVTQSGGGVWIDNGTHSVDLLRYLCGEITWVQAHATPAVQELEVEDGIRVVAGFDCGASALVDLSWSVPPTSPYFLEIHGSLGSLLLGWRESVLCLADGRRSVIGGGYDKRVALARQLANFASAALGEVEPALLRDDIVASVVAVERGYESLRTGARVATR